MSLSRSINYTHSLVFCFKSEKVPKKSILPYLQHICTHRHTIRYAKKKFDKILLIAFSFPFRAHCVYVYSRQAWQRAKAFYFVARLLICSRPFQSESSSVTEGGGQERKKNSGFLWSRVTANRDKLLASEFEGVFLEIWRSIVDCVLSLPKKYKLSPSDPLSHADTNRWIAFMVVEFTFLRSPNLC